MRAFICCEPSYMRHGSMIKFFFVRKFAPHGSSVMSTDMMDLPRVYGLNYEESEGVPNVYLT